MLTPCYSSPLHGNFHAGIQLSTSDLVQLSQVLRHLFPTHNVVPDIEHLPKTIHCYKRIEFGIDSIFSVHSDSRYGRHSYILANWADSDGDIDLSYGLRPGHLQLIFLYRFCPAEGTVCSRLSIW